MDIQLRQLERKASQGDEEAAVRLYELRNRLLSSQAPDLTAEDIKQIRVLYHNYCGIGLYPEDARECVLDEVGRASCGGVNYWGIQGRPSIMEGLRHNMVIALYSFEKRLASWWAGPLHRAIRKLRHG